MTVELEAANLILQVESPLGKDQLVLARLDGTEAISEPFRFVLDLRSGDPDLDRL